MTDTQVPGPFTFLSVLDGKTYEMPPYDPALAVDEVSKHIDSIPKVTLSDALLADDPDEGLALLEAPQKRLNFLMNRTVTKTLRNHFTSDTDPTWLALKALLDAPRLDAVGKILTEWREHYGDVQETNGAGEG